LAGPRADGDPALPAQRVDGIGQDVGEDLVQLAAVSLDRRQLWGIVALYFDAGQARAQDEQGILQAGVYVDSLDRSLIQKSVRFQLLNDGRYAGRALRHVVQEVGYRGIGGEQGRQGRKGFLRENAKQLIQTRRVHPQTRQDGRHLPRLTHATRLKPGLQAGFQIAAGQRIQRRGGSRGGSLGQQRSQPLLLGRSQMERRELDLRLVQLRHHSLQLLAATPHGCRRIVQLVGDPGGERAELGQLFTLAKLCFGVAPPGKHCAQDSAYRRRAAVQQLVQLVLVNSQDEGVGARPYGSHTRRALDQGHLANNLARTVDRQ